MPADTADNLKHLVHAVERLLSARQDDMLTAEEWAALAEAVAACTGQAASWYLTERDQEELSGEED